jgi:hypothetical protein
MSKFDDLAKIVEDVTEENKIFREKCEKFADGIIKGLIGYFEVPKDQFMIVPTDGGEDRSYYLVEALTPDVNLFWHFGIKLKWTKNVYPGRAILLHISFKKENNHFTVSLDNSDPDTSFSIHENVPAEYDVFFDFIYSQIRNSYENNRLCFYRPEEPRQIGF